MEGRRKAGALIVLAVVLAGGGFYAYSTSLAPARTSIPSSICVPQGNATQVRSTLAATNITAITEWELPPPGRYPNAVVVASDGSIWFGEQALAGVAHFFPANGSLVEYAWPETTGHPGPADSFQTSIWGVALWRGMVWATNAEQNSIVGLNATSDTLTVCTLPIPNSSPYTLIVGPDGALWFTALTQTAFIGRISASSSSSSLSLSMYSVKSHPQEIPSDLQFLNSSFAYYSALDPYVPKMSGVYSFDPKNLTDGIYPTPVGGNVTLYDTTSVSASGAQVWVVQHYTSNLWEYNLTSNEWTVYPTSTENYTDVTLPYFVRTSGNVVFFNEHYGNRMAELNPAPVGTLTEYSEANPPVDNGTQIQNDLTIAAASGGLWFTSMTGNYVGFLNSSYRPSFWVTVGNNSVTLAPNESATVNLLVGGSWKGSLNVTTSDSETQSSVPLAIQISPSTTVVPQGSERKPLTLNLSLMNALEPGRYTVAVSLSDGLIIQTAYIFVTVT